MWFNRLKSSLQALPIFSLVMSISQQIHNYPHKFPSILRGWEDSDTLISNDEWLWMVARRPSTTKWKVIIQTIIWYHRYYTLATLSVMFACHPIWRGHPPSRDPWRHVKTHYCFGGNQPWPSRSNLRSKSKFTPFWTCPHHNSSPIQSRITKFEPEVQNTLVKIPIVLGGNWLRPSRSNLT